MALEPEVDVLGVTLTSPTRAVFPEAGVTKADLAFHYMTWMDRLLPHVVGRPLALVRCPSGRASRSQFRTDPGGLPERMAHDLGEAAPVIVVETAQDIIELVQRGTLEIHVRPVRVDKIDRPDRIIFDLDPADDVPFSAVRAAAVLVRDELRARNLDSFALATGGRGVHIMVPTERRISVEDASAWSRAMAGRLEALAPRRFTTNKAKASRRGRILLSAARNEVGGASAAPYSSRMRPGAPMAAPLGWDELAILERSSAFRVGHALWSAHPWVGMKSVRQRIGRMQWQGL